MDGDSLQRSGAEFEALRDEAHVWLLRLDEHAAPGILALHRSVLDPRELARHRRYLRDESRDTFAIAHGALRRTLSHYADVAPQEWSFAIGEHGRPEIDAPAPLRDLRFNLSHTRGLVAFVVTAGIDCGIDVEATGHAKDPLRLAERVFAASELEDLRAQPPGNVRARFHEYWTLKEAYIKARGLGLALPLRDFAFEIGAASAVAIRFGASIDDDPSRWQFECRRPTPQHQLALALGRPGGGNGRPIPVRVRTVALPATRGG